MAEQILEGTWEEIALHAGELSGKHIRVIVSAEEEGRANLTNEGMLTALDNIVERQKGRKETSGEETQRLLREARAGGMYGLESFDE